MVAHCSKFKLAKNCMDKCRAKPRAVDKDPWMRYGHSPTLRIRLSILNNQVDDHLLRMLNNGQFWSFMTLVRASSCPHSASKTMLRDAAVGIARCLPKAKKMIPLECFDWTPLSLLYCQKSISFLRLPSSKVPFYGVSVSSHSWQQGYAKSQLHPLLPSRENSSSPWFPPGAARPQGQSTDTPQEYGEWLVDGRIKDGWQWWMISSQCYIY